MEWYTARGAVYGLTGRGPCALRFRVLNVSVNVWVLQAKSSKEENIDTIFQMFNLHQMNKLKLLVDECSVL